jgi:ASC-1-like (ASCH) protein
MLHYLKEKLEPIEALTKANMDSVIKELPNLEALMLALTTSRKYKKKCKQTRQQQQSTANHPSSSTTGTIWNFPIRLKKKYYQLITAGLKDIECRLNTGQFKKFKVGDSFHFVSFQLKQWVKITARHVFPDVKTALQHLSLARMLPDCVSIDEAVKEYNTFPNYQHFLSQQNPKALVAFEFTLIPDPTKVQPVPASMPVADEPQESSPEEPSDDDRTPPPASDRSPNL